MNKDYSYRGFFGRLLEEQEKKEIRFEKIITNPENGQYELEIISVNGCPDILAFKKKLEDIIRDSVKELSSALISFQIPQRLELLANMKGGLDESHFLFVTEESQPYFPFGFMKGGVQFITFKCLRDPRLIANVPDEDIEILRLQILNETSRYAKEAEEIILWGIRRIDFLLDQIQFGGKEYSHYVHPERIDHLEQITNTNFDLSRLIQLCIELNHAYGDKSYYSVLMLLRAIIDHIPPIFNKQTFAEVSGSYGSRSFRETMTNLEKSLRKIADSALHTPIRSKEVLPNSTQVDFSQSLDVLLAEIYRLLK